MLEYSALVQGAVQWGRAVKSCQAASQDRAGAGTEPQYRGGGTRTKRVQKPPKTKQFFMKAVPDSSARGWGGSILDGCGQKQKVYIYIF